MNHLINQIMEEYWAEACEDANKLNLKQAFVIFPLIYHSD